MHCQKTQTKIGAACTIIKYYAYHTNKFNKVNVNLLLASVTYLFQIKTATKNKFFLDTKFTLTTFPEQGQYIRSDDALVAAFLTCLPQGTLEY